MNPEMGFVLTVFPMSADSGRGYSAGAADFASVISFRIPWSFLEPEEGRFNWPLMDTAAQRWVARGKRIAIRVTCSEAWLPYATPEWVKDAGAAGWNYRYGKGRHAKGHCWDPDPTDPIFLQKLQGFLRALASRYDGNPNVACVEVGSLGLSGLCRATSSSRVPDKVLEKAGQAHIDLYADAFKSTPLVIGAGDTASRRDDGPALVDYAASRGVLIRDDGYSLPDDAGDGWRRAPRLIGDPHDGMPKAKDQNEDFDISMQTLELSHATYAPLPPSFAASCDEHSEIVARLARAVGYRFELQAASWPSSVPIGDPFEIEIRWRNAGVAPCYRGGFVSMTLKSANGGIVAVLVDDEFDIKCLMPESLQADGGEPDAAERPEDDAAARTLREMAAPVTRRMRFIVGENDPLTPAGLYDLSVSIGLRDGTPVYELPLPHNDGSRRYLLGKIRLQSPY